MGDCASKGWNDEEPNQNEQRDDVINLTQERNEGPKRRKLNEGAEKRDGRRKVNWNGQRRNSKVPYEIDPSLSNDLHDRINEAIKTIQQHSRFKFVKGHGEHDVLKITRKDGCYFMPDGIGKGYISLGIGCERSEIILHELLHALGLPHEHKRPDRDEFITINFDNIKKGKGSQFEKLRPNDYIWNEFDYAFDYDSIMMYGEYAFSENEQKTIERKDGKPLPRNTTLSYLDKEKLGEL